MNAETIKFASGKKIFLEGCHIGEIGTFAAQLASMTGRIVERSYGASSENATGTDWVKFSSRPETSAEAIDPDYDMWKRGNAQLGEYTTVKRP